MDSSLFCSWVSKIWIWTFKEFKVSKFEITHVNLISYSCITLTFDLCYVIFFVFCTNRVDPKSAQLKPHTKGEIKNIGWFNISQLPENKHDPNVVSRDGFPNNAFHGVFPYVK